MHDALPFRLTLLGVRNWEKKIQFLIFAFVPSAKTLLSSLFFTIHIVFLLDDFRLENKRAP